MKKIFLIAIVVLIAVTAISGCTFKQSNSIPSPEFIVETMYEPAEISKPSLDQVGDWIYYAADWLGLYKMKSDSSEITQLSDAHTEKVITRLEDWVYYIASEKLGDQEDGDTAWHDNVLYKIKADGKQRTEILRCSVPYGWGCIYDILDDWIYYVDGSENNGFNLRKMRTDGTQKTKIEKIEVYQFTGELLDLVVADGWIYYAIHDVDDKYKTKASYYLGNESIPCVTTIYKINSDGKKKEVLYKSNGIDMYIRGNSPGPMGDLKVYEDSIYFTEGIEMKRISTNGGEAQVLTDSYTELCLISEDWVYFTCSDSSDRQYYTGDDYGIYKIRTDGTEKTRLNSDRSPQNLILVNDTIYYLSEEYENDYWISYLYKIGIDGMNKQKVCSLNRPY